MISDTSMTILTISTVITILFPIVIAVVWIVKTKAYVYPLFIGALIFVVFALILESSMHTVILSTIPILNDNIVLYVLYACLAAGFFEEGGRWIAFRYLIKNKDKKNAVTFGIGHGGMEMLLVVGMTLFSTLLFAWTCNSLGLEGMLAESQDAGLETMIMDTVASIEAYGIFDAVLSLIERASAMVLHVSCSVLVFNSVLKKDINYLGYSFGLHALVNVPAALFQKGVLTELWLTELFIIGFTVLAAVFAYKTYKKMGCE